MTALCSERPASLFAMKDYCTEFEACEYLNIGWRNIETLVEVGQLHRQIDGTAHCFDRREIAALGSAYISSLELSARRLKRHVRSASAEMRKLGLNPVIGDFFWNRAEVDASYLL